MSHYSNWNAILDQVYAYHTICTKSSTFALIFMKTKPLMGKPWRNNGELPWDCDHTANLVQMCYNLKYSLLMRWLLMFKHLNRRHFTTKVLFWSIDHFTLVVTVYQKKANTMMTFNINTYTRIIINALHTNQIINGSQTKMHSGFAKYSLV